MATNILEGLEQTFPRYLTPADREEMASALRQFPILERRYYGPGQKDVVWQGDVFEKLQAMAFRESGPIAVRQSYLVLSNTCDLSESNRRERPIHVALAPVASLKRFHTLLSEGGSPPAKIDSLLTSIRRQDVTSVFYLPGGCGGVSEESIAFLDAVVSLPPASFRADPQKARTASLSNVGWYVLLVKLAIHFCRAFEGEPRPRNAAEATGSPEAP